MQTPIPAKAFEQGHKSWVDLDPAWGPAMRVSHELFLPGSSGDQIARPIPARAFKDGKRSWIELFPKGRRPMRVTHEFMGLEQPFAEAEKQESARRTWADFVLEADRAVSQAATVPDKKAAAGELLRLFQQTAQLIDAYPSIQAGFAPGEWPQLSAALRSLRAWTTVRDRLFQVGDLVSSVAPTEVSTLLNNAAVVRERLQALASAPVKAAKPTLKGLEAASSLGWVEGLLLVGAAAALVMWVASESPLEGADEVESEEEEADLEAPRGGKAHARSR